MDEFVYGYKNYSKPKIQTSSLYGIIGRVIKNSIYGANPTDEQLKRQEKNVEYYEKVKNMTLDELRIYVLHCMVNNNE